MQKDNPPGEVDALLVVTARFARRSEATGKKKRKGWN
jgi:hypothetical protein